MQCKQSPVHYHLRWARKNIKMSSWPNVHQHPRQLSQGMHTDQSLDHDGSWGQMEFKPFGKLRNAASKRSELQLVIGSADVAKVPIACSCLPFLTSALNSSRFCIWHSTLTSLKNQTLPQDFACCQGLPSIFYKDLTKATNAINLYHQAQWVSLTSSHHNSSHCFIHSKCARMLWQLAAFPSNSFRSN